MATVALNNPTLTAVDAPPARATSLTHRGLAAMGAVLAIIFALTFALALAQLGDVPMVAKVGFAAFATFWLGGGFGLIFAGSAIADHLHNGPEH